MIAPICVNAIYKLIDPKTSINIDLRDIRIVKKLGGTVEDTELVEGLVFNQKATHSAGGPSKVKDAKIGLIQFQISPPKTNVSAHVESKNNSLQMDSSVVVTDYQQMDRILREEKNYLLNICNKIKKSGCNVLLIQKSILRDAVTEMSLHFLAKLKIMVVRDIERDEIEFISKVNLFTRSVFIK